ncbi:hypothetical protein [Aminobacter sp. MSH1]|uniref:hypothetical protein n=1 Tax=Aminobacter sp. MSH1 TaxID=374606 RepID=UPI000D3CF360|nr:hypothetical protein [Aminobacter sp. MSH1]
MARTLAEAYRQQKNAPDAITVELANIAYSFLRDLDAIETRNKELLVEMDALESQGLIYATEYWRPDVAGNSKYLYLHYPQRGPQRNRQYVGADPAKIAEAQAGIARAKAYDKLASEQAGIKKRVNDAHLHMGLASGALSDKPRLYRGW